LRTLEESRRVMSLNSKDDVKVAAVVVTFNRKKLLLECLDALRNQTRPPNAIFIIDGPSTDGTPEALVQEGYIKETPPQPKGQYSWKTKNMIISSSGAPIRVVYVRLYEDVGGAGGFHEGVKLAYNEGYDWIWLMDDDAEPKKNALEELLKYIKLPDVVALKCLVVDPTGVVHVSHWNFSRFFCGGLFREYDTINLGDTKSRDTPIVVPYGSFVGLLVSSTVIKEIGLPMKEFFIYNDDVEYGLRLSQIGKVYLVPQSVIVHKGDSPQTKRKKSTTKWGLVKRYYSIRNQIYIVKKYKWNIGSFLVLLKCYLYHISKTRPEYVSRWRWVYFITSAYLDGIRGVFDNKKPKRILYGGKRA